MMFTKLLIAICLVSALEGLILANAAAPASDLDPFEGVVKEVNLKLDGGADILVDRDIKGGMDRVRFHLDKSTPITFSDKRKAKVSDLKTNQKVTVRTTSEIRDKCPPQMDADAVIIKAQKK